MFDDAHVSDLLQISNSISRDNIGDAMFRASLMRSIIVDPATKIKAEEILNRIRNFAREADIGWKIFENPILPNITLTEMQTWQIMAIVGTLLELNYSFERVEEASMFTFENSAPVRFYVNGIFHYLATLFLLDAKDNQKRGFPRPGTLIKVLKPIGLGNLLNPIYQVLDRLFGAEMTYGQTILSIRNKGFVHGSFSPENIKKTVIDSHIFNELQRIRFVQNHWDLFDRLIILRLQLISILTLMSISLDDFSPSKLYHL
jgi:hypothetical protein